MDDQIKVAIRVRPLLARETDKQCLWEISEQTIRRGTEAFSFDHVFDSNTSTSDVYEQTVRSIVQSTMLGYNGTIFAYGQTSSGKTHTIMGQQDNPGVIAMALDDIFSTIENTPDREYLLQVAYLEIYNEKLHDLLIEEGKPAMELRVLQEKNEVHVKNLKTEVVSSPAEILELVEKAQDRRHVGETNMNERSSRSHTIFRIIIESREKLEVDSAVSVSLLNIVDLAGSENAAQTGAKGERQFEGSNINKSLHTLSRVISQLSSDGQRPHVSFRDSNLTFILQTSLGGNAKTLIICTVAPCSGTQTSSTLNFASSVKKIKNKPVKNEIISEGTMLRQYKNRVEELTNELRAKDSEHDVKALQTENVELNQEVLRLREQIEKIKHSILTGGHASGNESNDAARKANTRNPRRQTWCPGLGRRPRQSVGLYNSQSMSMDASFEHLPSSELMRDFDMREKAASNLSSPVVVPLKRSRNVAGFSSMLETVQERQSSLSEATISDSAMSSEVESQLRDRIAQLEKQLSEMKLPEQQPSKVVVEQRNRFVADPNLEESCIDETVTGQLIRSMCETPKALSNARRRTIGTARRSNACPTVFVADANLEETAAEEGDDTFLGDKTETETETDKTDVAVSGSLNDDIVSEKLRALHEQNRELQDQLRQARLLLENGVDSVVRAEIERLMETNVSLSEERNALVNKCSQLESDIREKDDRIQNVQATVVETVAVDVQVGADAVVASTQVGDDSLNISSTSRVPDSQLDRSSTPDADMVQMCENLLKENEVLQVQLREAKSQLVFFAAKLDSLEGLKQTLEQKLDERDMSYDALKSFQVHEQDLLGGGNTEEMQERIRALESRNAKLEQQVEELKEYQGEFDSLQDYVHWKKNADDALTLMRDFKAQLATCESTFAEETRQHALLKEQFAKQTTDLKNARRDVADYEYMLETERKGLQTKIRDLQTRIAEMDAEKDDWRTRANQFSEVSQEQLDENVRVIGEKNAEIDQLKGDIADLQHRLDAMSAAVQETELAKVEQLRDASEQIDAWRSSAVEYATTIEELKGQIAQLEDGGQEVGKQMEVLQSAAVDDAATIADLKCQVERLQGASVQVDGLRESTAEYVTTINQLKSQIEQLEERSKQVDILQTAAVEYAATIADLKCQVERLQGASEQVEVLNAAMQESEMAKMNQLRDAGEQVEVLRSAAIQDAATIADLKSRIEQLEDSLKQAEGLRLAAVNDAATIAELKRQLEQLQDASEQAIMNENLRIIGEKNAEIEQLKSDIADLQQRLDAMNAAMQESELAKMNQLRDAGEQIDGLRSVEMEYAATINELKGQIDQLNAQLLAVQSESAEKQMMIDGLQRRKKQLEAECDKMDEFEEETNQRIATLCVENEQLKVELAKAPSSRQVTDEVNQLQANYAKLEAEKETHRLESTRLGMRAVGLERQLRAIEKDHKAKLTELEKEVAVKDQRIRHLKDELRVATTQLQQQEPIVLRAAANQQLQQRASSTQSLNAPRGAGAATGTSGSIVENFLLQEERQKRFKFQKDMEELTKQLKDRDDMIQKLQGELLARRESINLSSLKENDEPSSSSSQTPSRSSMRGLPSMLRSSSKKENTTIKVVDAPTPKTQSATPQRRTPVDGAKAKDSPNCRQQ